MKKYANKVLLFLEENNIDYADIRFTEKNVESIEINNGVVSSLEQDKDMGYGIRVLYKGSWGFASSDTFDDNKLIEKAKDALEVAKASYLLQKKPVKLAKEDVYSDFWQSPVTIDPFSVPISEKLDLLLKIDKILREKEEIKSSSSSMYFENRHSWFYSSEGSKIEQNRLISGAGYSVTAVGNNDVQVRSYPASFGGQYKQLGYELINGLELIKNAAKTRDEAIALLSADNCPDGMFDLILHPNQLLLQIHESVGHPTELDRVIGQEANFAGTSFVTTEKYKNFQYGSDIVNLVADTTLPTGIATMGYDDDGVKAQRWYIVKDGVFNGYMTNRETASIVSEERSKGANRASSWYHTPITRIANLSLMPGDSSFKEMVKSIEYGLYMETNKSWSIDQQRLNFQFGCEIAYEIKNGKLTGKIFKNPTYQGITPEFWNSCDMIANYKEWDIWGVLQCGKGQPMQVSEMSHGSSFTKFRKVQIGV